jgi:ribose/xylose/arabinose/galactoside ABC-type transport system permease subunit
MAVHIPAEAKTWWFSCILAIEPEPRWLLVVPGVWILISLSVLLALALRYSLLGRYTYAIGSNEATTRVCGINVLAVEMVVYTLAGMVTGLAGIMQFVYFDAMGTRSRPTTWSFR